MQSSRHGHYRALGACVFAWTLTAGIEAADSVSGSGQTAKSSGDAQLARILRDVINRGADLYNSGDQNGCYRLFQGALMTARAQLENHPELQKAIDAGFAEAERHFSGAERAFALRRVIDTIRTGLKSGGSGTIPGVKSTGSAITTPGKSETSEKKPAKHKPEANLPPTLWERLGGETNVKKVIDDFVSSASADPMVNFSRNGKIKLDAARIAQFKKEMLDYVSQETGGPYKYTGKSMKESHRGMGITDSEFNASVRHLKKAFEGNGVRPADVDQILKAVDSKRKDLIEKKRGDKEHDSSTEEIKHKNPGKPDKPAQP